MQFKNIVHTTEYQKDGQVKKKYTTVGTLFIYDDGGMSIKLDAIPVGFDGKLSVYDRDENRKPNPRTDTSRAYEQPKPLGEFPKVPGTDIPLETDMEKLPF